VPFDNLLIATIAFGRLPPGEELILIKSCHNIEFSGLSTVDSRSLSTCLETRIFFAHLPRTWNRRPVSMTAHILKPMSTYTLAKEMLDAVKKMK
jgi:hypothetical protein